MITTLAIISKLAVFSYTPLLPGFEAVLNRRGYELRRASYEILAGIGEGSFEFISSNAELPVYTVNIELSPTASSKFPTKFENVQAVFKPTNLSITGAKSVEGIFGRDGGGTIRVVVPYACYILSERPLTTPGARGLKVTSIRPRATTEQALREISNLLVPELSSTAKNWRWGTDVVKGRYLKKRGD
jgi:hypothetical protein